MIGVLERISEVGFSGHGSLEEGERETEGEGVRRGQYWTQLVRVSRQNQLERGSERDSAFCWSLRHINTNKPLPTRNMEL